MLDKIVNESSLSLYEIEPSNIAQNQPILKRYIASTPETRCIVNDPLVFGYEYTKKLTIGSAKILKSLKEILPSKLASSFTENQSVVLNILRGGLNFGIRDALADSLSWNQHSSAFISAQRQRNFDDPESWHITEGEYKKVYLPKDANIIFGDVVATGTSLEYALKNIISHAKSNDQTISSFLFITIGGPRSEEILARINLEAAKAFPNFCGSTVVYLEGRFLVATPETPVEIKFSGTDLLRRDSLVAEEFLQSQLENPLFALERCTIYDAGSRAFWIPEYLEDVIDYWEKTKDLFHTGHSYKTLILQRFPEIFPLIELERPEFFELDFTAQIDKHLNLLSLHI